MEAAEVTSHMLQQENILRVELVGTIKNEEEQWCLKF